MRGLRLILALGLATIGAASAAHPSRGLAVAPDGQVFFSDHERIWSIAPDGRMTIIRASIDGQTHELFLDEGGHLYGEVFFPDAVKRRHRAAIWMRTPGGQIETVYGPTERPTLGAGVFRDRFGCSYQAGGDGSAALLLFRLCPSRPPSALPGSLPPGQAPARAQLFNLGGAAFGPDGSFFFRRGTIVQRLRADDRLVTAAAGFSSENAGIAVDDTGALYVAESGRGRVVRVGLDGRRSVALTTGPLWAPTGLAARGAALYVLEVTRPRPGHPERYRVRRVERGRVSLLGVTPARS